MSIRFVIWYIKSSIPQDNLSETYLFCGLLVCQLTLDYVLKCQPPTSAITVISLSISQLGHFFPVNLHSVTYLTFCFLSVAFWIILITPTVSQITTSKQRQLVTQCSPSVSSIFRAQLTLACYGSLLYTQCSEELPKIKVPDEYCVDNMSSKAPDSLLIKSSVLFFSFQQPASLTDWLNIKHYEQK